MPNRKQRQANRRAKRAMRHAKFQQSGFYQAFHKEKPKGSRGYQVISKAKNKGLTGKLGLKEKLQDLVTKDGHSDCPTWSIDKDTGQKICTSGGGKPSSSGSSSSTTTKTPDTSSSGGGGDFTMNFPALNFKGPKINLPGFGIEAGGDANTGTGWHPPLEAPEKATGKASGFLSFSTTGNSEKEEQKSMKDNEIMVNEEMDEDAKNKKNVRYIESPPGGF